MAQPLFAAEVLVHHRLAHLGVRGDLLAVLKAILLDAEARAIPPGAADSYGKLREPILRLSQWLRAFNATSASGEFRIPNTDNPGFSLGQSPLLWTLSWLLGQLALVLYWRLGLFNFFFAFNEEALGWCLTLFNAALWGILLLVPAHYRLMPSWLAGLAAGFGVTLLALLALFDAASPWVWPAWLAWLGAAYLRWHHRFIAGLAMGCLSLIAVILAALGKWMEPDMNGFLLLSLIAIGLSVMASRWLQQQRRSHA